MFEMAAWILWVRAYYGFLGTLGTRGPIHRHCPKIYLKTCHKIIL